MWQQHAAGSVSSVGSLWQLFFRCDVHVGCAAGEATEEKPKPERVSKGGSHALLRVAWLLQREVPGLVGVLQSAGKYLVACLC
jgi:hypothetical protein